MSAGLENVPPESMASPKATSDWQKWKARLADPQNPEIAGDDTLAAPSCTTPPSAVLTKTPTPSHLKLLMRFDNYLVRTLEAAAMEMWYRGPHRPEWLFMGFRCFLGPGTIEKILVDFHLVTTKEILKTRVGNWKYWEDYGEELWSVVDKLRCEVLETGNRDEPGKQRETHEQKTGEIFRTSLGASAGLVNAKPAPPSGAESTSLHDIQDTVGAVAWDVDARLAAGVSR